MKQTPITPTTGEPTIDLALDTIRINKQALIFVNSKRSAEATAEKTAKKTGIQPDLQPLGEQILGVLSSPTKQCRRLAYCVERGTAFHHAGLSSKQRHIVEEAFIEGKLRVIAATPTLAAGVNVPAFRTIIRDLKRYTGAGMTDIPVLEYLQMAGRAGRPDFNDEYGEAIVIAKNNREAQAIEKKYLRGEPENIYSKVASQPVLRTYCLSLIASEFVQDREELISFFNDTFFAHQYGDLAAIENKLDETIQQLQEWGFLHGTAHDDFTSADELREEGLSATPLGKRVSELYLDPLSAHQLINGLRVKQKVPFTAYTHLVCTTQEMRPLLRLKMSDYEELELYIEEHKELLIKSPSVYDPDYDNYLQAIKTSMLLNDWSNEQTEQTLLETYNVRPGELRARNDIADWLFYGAAELARILKLHHHITPLHKARTRIQYGVREELLPLLTFKNIGRVRARTLHNNGIRNTSDIKRAPANNLSSLLGPKTAKSLKEQVGEKIDEPLSPKKRTGQLSLENKRFNKQS